MYLLAIALRWRSYSESISNLLPLAVMAIWAYLTYQVAVWLFMWINYEPEKIVVVGVLLLELRIFVNFIKMDLCNTAWQICQYCMELLRNWLGVDQIE